MKFPGEVPQNHDFQAICFGYNSCDILCRLPHYPAQGEKLGMVQMLRSGGGQAASAAACLAVLGVRTKYLGKFGNTEEGNFAHASLADIGVDLTGCITVPDTQNQVAVIWIDSQNGERTITHMRAPELQIVPGEFNFDQIANGGLLFIDGHDIPAAIELAKYAKRAGMPVLLDIEKVREGISDLLALCDFILANQHFPIAYTGDKEPRIALQHLQQRHRTPFVAMTLGERGSLAYCENTFFHTPAFQIDVVDTTGAGDVWHGAFAAGFLWGWSVLDTLRFASAAAALKCRKLGGRDGIADKNAVLEFMAAAKTIEATV